MVKRYASIFLLVALVAVVAAPVWAAPQYSVKKAATPITCDGDMSKWAGITPFELKLPDGGVVKTYAMWDASALYFAVTVEDKVHFNGESGTSIWKGDNLQIALDPLNDKSVGRYADDDYEFGYALTTAGLDSHAWRLASGVKFDKAAQKYAVVNRDGLTVYEVILDAAQIAPLQLKVGSVFGANVMVNDDDKTGERTYVQWTPGIGGGKNPSAFGEFTLVD